MNEKIIERCDKNIPTSLKLENRWCLYKIVNRNGKTTKIPIRTNGKIAKVNDINTFSSYEKSKKALLKGLGDGLGFLLGDGYVGIDIDKVDNEISEYFNDENAKNMTADFLSSIDTYAELSPSKKGIHLIGKGKINGSRRRYKNLEIYKNDRFFTVTGDILKDKKRDQINNITDDLDILYKKYMPKEKAKTVSSKKSNNKTYKAISFSENNTPLDMLFKYGYFTYSGDDIRNIYNGNFESYFNSQSEADFFMLQRLLYYTSGDVESAISYMYQSGLNRDKWYRKYTGTDYIHYIANKAVNSMSKFYDWNRKTKYSQNKKEKEADNKMRRYEVNDVKGIITMARDEIKQNTDEYSSFLKTLANNYKYPYVHQLSIYSVKPNSTACAEYDYWKKLGRVVKSGEKGIPLLDFESGKIKYIFDVSQTKSLSYNIAELKLFKYDSEKHITALDTLIMEFKEAGNSFNKSEIAKIDILSKLYSKKNFNNLLDKLSDETLKNNKKIEILAFLRESLKTSISERLGIKIDVDNEKFKILSNISNKDVNILFDYISKTNKNVLLALGKEIQNINSLEKFKENSDLEQTKFDSARYNVENDEDSNFNKNIGGMENGKSINVSGQRVSSGKRDLHSSSQGESIREEGRNLQTESNGRWRENANNEYSDSTGNRPKQIKQSEESQTKLSQRKQGTRLSNDDDRELFDGAPRDDRQSSGGLSKQGRTKDDDFLGTNKRDEEKRFSEVRKVKEKYGYGIDEHSNEPDSVSIELGTNIISDDKEVEKSTSFFYSKENPNILITDEMLERVPKFYKTESINLADKEVHAAYFVPFRSNWTWYLCEYDKESKNAFGLVLGNEAEWGYFNLDELEELNAQRLILEDFPKTFRELKDTELKKQLTESELQRAFNGELSFEDERIEKIEKVNADNLDEKVAVKVGYYYSLVDKEKLKDIKLSDTGTKVYPKNDNFKGTVYPIYAGETFEDSTKMDKLFDDLANELKDVDTTKLNDIFDMKNQGLYQVEEDKVTDYKEGYDYEISSFGGQFPDYHKEIFIFNKNLKINDFSQDIAYIDRDNKIKFNVELSDDEKDKITEIRDKKEILSTLIDKDIKEKSEYSFDTGSEIYILKTKNIEDGLLQNPTKEIPESETKKGYSADLILDFKNKEFKQNLKYNGLIVKTNTAIKYKSYSEMLRNIPYLLDDDHRDVMLEGFINNEILKDKEKAKQKSKYQVGAKVKYKGMEFEIARIDDKSSPKEIELEDNTDLMDGFITGSETILFNSYDDLNIEFIDSNLDKEKNVSSQITLSDVLDENTETNSLEIETVIEHTAPLKSSKPKEQAKNFKITKEYENLKPSVRLANNIVAIKTLIDIRNENRNASLEEQEILSKYVGWGGLADVFDERKEGQWLDARNFLKENLSSSEYEAAKESTLTAFYTPKVVMDSIYKAISNMGFDGGNILEPALGTGRFIGTLPDEMADSKFYGSEIDKISGEIAKTLYPEANINIKGFEKTRFSDNLFDLAVGNVPFGDFKLADRDYDKNNFLIHDYFFAKSLDKVRNGGLIAFITSSGTMDKQTDDIRRYISERAEFVGAIRLPNNTFKGEAGTEVTSDIIFLKKRDRLTKIDEDWQELKMNEEGLIYNKYFVDNPEMVLGKMSAVSTQYGTKLACLDDGTDLKEKLDKAILNIEGTYQKAEIDEDLGKEIVSAPDDTLNYSFNLFNGQIYFRENSIMQKVDLSDKDIERVKLYIELEKVLREVIFKQKNDLPDAEILISQKELGKIYDEFNKKYGRLNSRTNKRILRDDASFSLVSTLENLDKEGKFESKADIFTKRTIRKIEPVTSVENSLDALFLSMNEKARIDFDYMESLTGKSKIDIINELKGEIFLDLDSFEPNDTMPFNESINLGDFARKFVTKDEYLSGNIREKTHILDLYIKNIENDLNEEFSDYTLDEKEKFNFELENIKFQKDRLLEVMPKELEANEISVRLGTTFIPTSDYKDFIVELLKTRNSLKDYIDVKYSELTGEYRVEGKNLDSGNDLANLTYGTSRRSAYKLIEDALNLRDTKVYDYYEEDGKKKSKLNKKETMLARNKQEIIKNEFKKWIFDDVDRRTRLVKYYNENFNSVRLREYDGSTLTFEGMSDDFELRKHQKDAVARGIFGGNTLLAHAVGAGKTFEMIAIAMETKRLGLTNKSMFVVPNHITEQFGREFNQLYPLANILVATERDFTPARRKRFCSKIATGNYDAIVIGHTQFEKIPISKERQEYEINKQINEILEFIEMYKNDNNQNFTVKQMKKTQKKLEAKLVKLNDDFKKDDIVTFEELGIDKLFVDEVHKFKNLYLYTKMNNVAGISSSSSQRASDMFMKCRYMDEVTDGKGIVFATGTPVSNSMAELFTMQRYLQYNELKKMGLNHFDSWAATFGETITAVELSPDGNGYRSKTRFAEFYNLPELMTMVKSFMDIKTADMLNLPVPTPNYEIIKTMPTEEQKEILKSFGTRADDIRNNVVKPNIDNMLLVTHDGKKMALDQRLINPLLADDENSKVNSCVKNVFSIWDKYKEDKLTQLVFCDMSVPSKNFNVYDDIKDKLVNLGVNENEIDFIHNAKNNKGKDKIFDKVRKGETRILLGSTDKMGEGTNVQDRLIAMHDLDVPWRPSDLERAPVAAI